MPATRSHTVITARLLIGTVALLVTSAWAAITIASQAGGDPRWWWLYPPVLLLQALLFQRLYSIGHEASHRKLIPGDALRNDPLGQLMMLPSLIQVRTYFTLLWYLGVLAGGHFLHSVASVIIFLFVPTCHAENVRALRQHGVLSWLWLNFNQHASHHMFPNVPWYQLPERRQELPAPLRVKNQDTDRYWRAILQQLAGPTIVYAQDADPTPHLFVRWED